MNDLTILARHRWRLSGRELVVIFLFWTSLATLTAVNRLLDPRGFGLRVISPANPIALAYVESWIWAAVTPVVFWLSSRLSLERSRWLVRIPILLAIGVIVAVSVYFLLEVAREEIFEPVIPHRHAPSIFAPLHDLGRLRFVNQLLVYMAVLAAGYAREYFMRDQERAREAAALASRTATLQAQLADARLDALRMQLNPHFLFNTLHAVSALVERDPAGVRRMIARLSDLLRLAMDTDAEHEVTVNEELDFLRRYIEIMEIRFQGQLRVDVEADPATLSAYVPRLILQPIVENAFEHGAARAGGEGRVEIVVRRRDDRLVIAVRDNGPGILAAVESGVGLSNTRARLAELYGAGASFRLAAHPDGGSVAELTFPFREARHG
jgi:two-component system LytT family sensor kinase